MLDEHRRPLPPHDYLTQDLTNGKVRLFAVEHVGDGGFENLRAVATLDRDSGLRVRQALAELAGEIDEMAEELASVSDTGRVQVFLYPEPEDPTYLAIRAMTTPGSESDEVRDGVAVLDGLPTAVATAVRGELDRLLLDGPAVIASVQAQPPLGTVPEDVRAAVEAALAASDDPIEQARAFDAAIEAADLPFGDQFEVWRAAFARAAVERNPEFPLALRDHGPGRGMPETYGMFTLAAAIQVHRIVREEVARWTAEERMPDGRDTERLYTRIRTEVGGESHDTAVREAIWAVVDEFIETSAPTRGRRG